MIEVSKIYPSGIQFKNRSNVSRVARIRLGCSAIWRTSEQSWKIDENSAHIVVFRFLVFVWVICSAEKSNTSSESNRRITMLFSQIDKFVRHELMISEMKSGQS